MNKANDFIFRAVITENGYGYNSHCLDIDISSQGATIEEAKLNLLKQFESKFKCTASPLNNYAIPPNNIQTAGSYIVDEFYFEHRLSSFADFENNAGQFLPELKHTGEFDPGFVLIK
mgnify:CR=1 FL=1